MTKQVKVASRRCHAPDDIADIIGHQQRFFIGPQCNPYWPAIGHAFIRCQKARQNVAGRATGLALREGHKYHSVTAELAAIP